MDGSFAIAFILVHGMALANLCTLTFGVAFVGLRRFGFVKRVGIASGIAMVGGFSTLWLTRESLMTDVDDPSWFSLFPETSLTVTLISLIVLGCIAFIAFIIPTLRVKGGRLWSLAKWLLIPWGMLHIGLSVLAVLVILAFSAS